MRKLILAAGIAVLGTAAVALVVLLMSGSDEHASAANLNVSVQGVPEYIYVGTEYELTVDYANTGEAATGPVRVVIDLKGEGDIEVLSASDSGQASLNHAEWALANVDGNSSGQLHLKVKGLSPKDTSNANYDYAGYAGYAAYEDGFKLTARIERSADSGELASAVVIADEGVNGIQCAPAPSIEELVARQCVVIVKRGPTGSFQIESSNSNNPVTEFFTLADGEFVGFTVGGGPYTITELSEVFSSVICDHNEGIAVSGGGSNPTVHLARTQIDVRPVVVCTYRNSEPPRPNLGGVFPAILGRPDATPTKPAAAAGAAGTLAPPRTGDGGLVSD